MLQRFLLISSTFIVLSSLCPTLQAAQLHHTERATTRARIHVLDKLLAQAQASGHLPPRVHVYGHSLAEKLYYENVIRKYYPHSHVLDYHVVPEAYVPGYVERVRANAANDFIFWGDLPPSYPPFWEPIWDPFFREYPRWGIHTNHRPHRHRDNYHHASTHSKHAKRHHPNNTHAPLLHHKSAAITHPSHMHHPHAHQAHPHHSNREREHRR